MLEIDFGSKLPSSLWWHTLADEKDRLWNHKIQGKEMSVTAPSYYILVFIIFLMSFEKHEVYVTLTS